MKNSIILIFLISGLAFGQTRIIEWQHAFGGSDIDACRDIEETLDNGSVFIGNTRSNDGDVSNLHGDRDYWIVKTNAQGDIQWERTFGGTDDDFGTAIEQTSDGGYIAIGTSKSTDGDISNPKGNYDMWVVKLSEAGTLEWEKSYGGSLGEFAASIKEIPSGGYILAGQSNSVDGDVTPNNGDYDFWVVKIDINGTIIWEHSYGGSDFDYASDIQTTTDNGFIISGTTLSNNGDVSGYHGGRDFWVVKIDQNGNLQWQKALGGSDWDASYSIAETSEGNYLVIGETNSFDGDVTHNYLGKDIWVVKLSSSGQLEWQNSFGSNAHDEGNYISQTQDGNYLISGSAATGGDVTGNNGNYDYWIAKLDPNGTILWQDSYGGSESERYAVAKETLDGGIIISGTTLSDDGDVSDYHGNYDFWVVKLSKSIATTLIPDPIFEQTLIDLEIDTDNTINGQVFTADIENINSLDVSGKNISELTGIEDFSALISLECQNNSLSSLNVLQNNQLQYLDASNNQLINIDLSQNPLLIQLGLNDNQLPVVDVSSNTQLTGIFLENNFLNSLNVLNNQFLESLWVRNNQINSLNLNSNTNLTQLSIENNQIETLDLSINNVLNLVRCNDNNLSALSIKNGNTLSIIDFDSRNNLNLLCVEVDANAVGNIPQNWQYDSGANFLEDCTLGYTENNIENSIIIFPNPTSQKLTVKVKNNIEIQKLTVANIAGQIIKNSKMIESLDVSSLKAGLYFLKIKTNEGTITKKIIKE